MFEFIPAWLAGVLLAIGVLGLLFKNKISGMVAQIGSPLGLKANMTLMIIAVIAILAGGFTFLTGFLSLGGATASVADSPVVDQDIIGSLDVKLSGGLANTTATEDYYNDAEDFVTFYSADASIADGEEYAFVATIERTKVQYAGAVTVTCVIADKEISGVTADNLAEKTSGRIDLDLNDTGNFVDDNTVQKIYTFAEGVASTTVAVAFDQEETYHDGMVDLDDYVDVTCDVDGVPFGARVYADS